LAFGRGRKIDGKNDCFSTCRVETEQLTYGHIEPDFLTGFAGGGIFNTLSPLDESGGKTPLTRFPGMSATPAKEQFAISFHDDGSRELRIKIRDCSTIDANRPRSSLDRLDSRFATTVLAMNHGLNQLPSPGSGDEGDDIGLEFCKRLSLQVDHVPDFILLDLNIGSL
jgi:hypothetical protein